ncbi:MAG: cysteine desulfurase [Gammaproteobacteria bacterium]|nr:cysteine desulfurase [Gammaproteobacteria bacterium]
MSAPSPTQFRPTFPVERIREDFPILHQEVRGKPLVYLDNGATVQKPNAVIDATARYYRHDNANVHRGVHALSERATAAYNAARSTAQRFINADDHREIVFVRGTTEAINLVAQTWGKANVGPGDEIILTELEHHANIVPWQLLCEQTGAKLRVAPIDDRGDVILEVYAELFSERTRLVAVSHVSNALGTINPIRRMIETAHAHGVPVLVDGAQAAPHIRIDVQELDCDFYAFSGHKVYGPTGIGVLYGKASLLDAMPPYQGGGDMVRRVSFEGTDFAPIPYKFEAGTHNIAGAIGLGVALDYVNGIGLESIAAHEHRLLSYATEALADVDGLRIIGTAREKAGLLSFVIEGAHAHDIGTIMDVQGVAIRAGHHCAMPAMQRFGVAATARASFAAYNTLEEVDALVAGITKVREVFRL